MRYIERVNGLYDGKMSKVGPLSMSDDILRSLEDMVGVEVFDFGGVDAPTHLITGIPVSLRVLRLDNWSGLTEGVVRDLATRFVECQAPGGACACAEVHGHWFTPANPYMTPGNMPSE